jgi:hypothetical protein
VNTDSKLREALTPETMKRGGRYNWKYQSERLVYVGKKGAWHQFEKVGEPGSVWCEVVSEDLHMIEETEALAQPSLPSDRAGLVDECKRLADDMADAAFT